MTSETHNPRDPWVEWLEKAFRAAHAARCEEDGHRWASTGGVREQPLVTACRWCGEPYTKEEKGHEQG